MANLEKSHASVDRFICIYPAYLNSKKTIAEGRRIPIEKAVQNPTCSEIADICRANKLNAVVEGDKMYTREWNRDTQFRGRVRVQLRNEDGSSCVDKLSSSKPRSCCKPLLSYSFHVTICLSAAAYSSTICSVTDTLRGRFIM
ncbi:hypothetical protein XENTR_v10002686 [Xenopus tropicalis]|nr:hypothetical protein XENTR_v10002686 [Xenopus tropicalis]